MAMFPGIIALKIKSQPLTMRQAQHRVKNYTYRLISVSVIFGFVLMLHIYYRQATVDASIHLFNIKKCHALTP